MIQPPPMYYPRPTPPYKLCTHNLIRTPSENCSTSEITPLCLTLPCSSRIDPLLITFPEMTIYPSTLLYPLLSLYLYLFSNYCITSPLILLATCQYILSISPLTLNLNLYCLSLLNIYALGKTGYAVSVSASQLPFSRQYLARTAPIYLL